jgi:SAM-dependent methyltransferase
MNMFVCPLTKQKLLPFFENGNLVSYNSVSGTVYKVIDDLPNFYVNSLDLSWQEYYSVNADSYDLYNHLTFAIQGFDEYVVRQGVVDLLNIKRGDKILELGCGTGRDTLLIADKAKRAGAKLHCLDASLPMILKCRDKLKAISMNDVVCAVANGEHIPFEDNYFDHFFSFVAFAPIVNKELFLKEVARVVKPGGKVIIGSEGLLPSLKGSSFGKAIIQNCNLYDSTPPLDILPIEARNISLRWILNGIIYILQFDVEVGEVEGNFDMIINGKRGGTINSRLHYRLEGVSSDTKDLFEKAVSRSNMSKYEWLNNCIKMEINRIKNESI